MTCFFDNVIGNDCRPLPSEGLHDIQARSMSQIADVSCTLAKYGMVYFPALTLPVFKFPPSL